MKESDPRPVPRTRGLGLYAALLCVAVLAACGGGGGGSGAGSPSNVTLSVTVSGGGSVTSLPAGIDCGTNCSATFSGGTDVTLTAAPAVGRIFVGWGGACTGSTNACVVPMDSAKSASATFAALPATGWGPSFLVSADGTAQARVAIDAVGNATAIWLQMDTGLSRRSVWASRRPVGGNWSAPVAIDSSDNDIVDLALAVEPTGGRAMATWWELVGGIATEVRARPASAEGTWGTTSLVSLPGRNAGNLSVAMDATGNAFVVWAQTATNNTLSSVWSNRYTASGGWAGAVRVANDGAQDLDPWLAVSGSGQAFVVWSRVTGGGIWASRSDANGSWGTPLQLASGSVNVGVASPRVAAGPNGNAVAVWAQATTSGGQIATQLVSKRWSSGAWSATAAPLYAPVVTNALSEVRLAVNAQGRAAAVWGLPDGGVRAAQSDSAGTWGTASTVRAAGTELRGVPDIGIDGQGDMFVIFGARHVTSGIDEVWLNRYTAGAWGNAALHQQSSDAAGAPRLAMNDRGNAVAAWIRNGSDGSRVVGRSFSSGR